MLVPPMKHIKYTSHFQYMYVSREYGTRIASLHIITITRLYCEFKYAIICVSPTLNPISWFDSIILCHISNAFSHLTFIWQLKCRAIVAIAIFFVLKMDFVMLWIATECLEWMERRSFEFTYVDRTMHITFIGNYIFK